MPDLPQREQAHKPLPEADSPGAAPARPLVSFIIPTLNSARTLARCLQSVRDQAYPRDRVEIILADGGSTDETLSIAARYAVDRVVANSLKTGEAGKSRAIEEARGELLALVDSDNILDSTEWLARMVSPFADPDIVAAEPLTYTRRDEDPALTRYFAMLGMNDPLCLFLGNYDRISLLTKRWTGLNVQQEDRGDYLKLTLAATSLPTIGANGFVFRRALLDLVRWQPYFFDIDIMQQAIAAGRCHVAKVRCGIVHLYCSRLSEFARKQDRRIKDFLFFSGERRRSYPWAVQSRAGVVRFCLYTLLVAPVALQAAKGWFRKRDAAWLYHVPACWITLAVYGAAVALKLTGNAPAPKSRDRWQAGADSRA